MRFLLFIVVSVLIANTANGQTKTCNCESNYEWLKKTFEENDAGFQYIIDKKGQAAYDIHNQLTLKKIKLAKTLTECDEIMDGWLKFFRSGHIGIIPLTIEIPNLQITNKKGDHETWNINIPQFEKHISEKAEASYEGIWTTGSLKSKIGIKKQGANYVAFNIDTTKKSVQVILTITQDGDTLNTTYYAKGRSPYKIPNPKLIGNNYLQFGEWGMWKRLSPIFAEDSKKPANEKYFKFLNSHKPYLEELNPTTLYLRIPSFNLNQKTAIDSVIAANKDKILKTKNLIIDIRNGTGGTDYTYKELLPFLYTNPIRTPGTEFLSTKLNNQQLIDILTKPEYHAFDEKKRQQIRELYDKLQSRLGEFVPAEEEVNIKQQDTIYEYPKNVGIIINHKNLSTDEQFLLEAKQSKKVKVFGTNTFGALDISNIFSVDSPCKEFKLTYCLSRSLRIPDMVIDDIGIQPDYFLDKSIPEYKWVEFVNEILNK